jgi:PhnB protein
MIDDDVTLSTAIGPAGTPSGGPPPYLLPELSVRHGRAAIEFYKTAFGAVEDYRVGGTDEHPAVVAQLSIGQASFWVSDESPPHGKFSPESLGGATVRMLLIVEDPASMAGRAITATLAPRARMNALGPIPRHAARECHSGRLVNSTNHAFRSGSSGTISHAVTGSVKRVPAHRRRYTVPNSVGQVGRLRPGVHDKNPGRTWNGSLVVEPTITGGLADGIPECQPIASPSHDSRRVRVGAEFGERHAACHWQ